MEIIGFGGIGEYTKGHIQLVLKAGLIIALTRFHVVWFPNTYYWVDFGYTSTSLSPPHTTNV